jgi:hypothetical protein
VMMVQRNNRDGRMRRWIIVLWIGFQIGMNWIYMEWIYKKVCNVGRERAFRFYDFDQNREKQCAIFHSIPFP